MAKVASLKSVDLSRQVGAAISSVSGDIISIGCSEVPKFGGGNYWDEDPNKKHDIDLSGEANKNEINRLIFDFLDILNDEGLIIDGKPAQGIPSNDGHGNGLQTNHLPTGIKQGIYLPY